MSTFSGGESIGRVVSRLPNYSVPNSGSYNFPAIYTVPGGMHAEIQMTFLRTTGGTSLGFSFTIRDPLGFPIGTMGGTFNNSGGISSQVTVASPQYLFNGVFRAPEGSYIDLTLTNGFVTGNTAEIRCLIREWVVAGGYVDLS